MNGLILFGAFFITHLVMDAIIRGRWGTTKKTKLFSHCFIYAIGFIPVFWVLKINFLWLLLLFFSHIFFDQPKFKYWWKKELGQIFISLGRGNKVGKTQFWKYSRIFTEQGFHIFILILIAVFS